MNADRLLEAARTAGLSLAVEDANLIVEADYDPPPELIAQLREHKAELIAVLSVDMDDVTTPVPVIARDAREVPAHAAIIGHDEAVPERGGKGPAWWRTRYQERAAHWEIGGQRLRVEAEEVVWGDVQWL